MNLVYGIAGEAKDGVRHSGDQYVIREQQDGVLLAVIDGLGHGVDACRASGIAQRVIEQAEDGMPLSAIVMDCHHALAGAKARGIVMTLIGVQADGCAHWLGVGNVSLMLWQHTVQGQHSLSEMLPAAGIVGHNLPALTVSQFSFLPGDILMLATDGIIPARLQSMVPEMIFSPQRFAERILTFCRNEADDALVLVAYRETHHEA